MVRWGGGFERREFKRPAGQGQEPLQRAFARQFAAGGMNEVAVLDVNPAQHVLVIDFEHGGVATQAFHLDDIVQTDAPQDALKTLLRRPVEQLVEHGKDRFEAFVRMRFFDEQFRAGFKAGRAFFLGGKGGERDFFQVGMPAAQQLEKLDAVQQRHADVHHHEVHFLPLEQFQGGVRRVREMHHPLAGAQRREGVFHGQQEVRLVIHEQDLARGRFMLCTSHSSLRRIAIRHGADCHVAR